MKTLAIDTSNQALSVAVLDDENLLAQTTLTVGKNHSVTLMPTIQMLMEQSKLKPAQLDRIVVAKGPGSYTGLRIGVTAAKTLAFALDKQLVGVSSLELLAANFDANSAQERLLVPLFDARRENVFAGVYQYQDEHLEVKMTDRHVSLAALCQEVKDKNPCFIGQDVLNLQEQITALCAGSKISFANGWFNYPQAYVLGRLGQQKQPVDIQTFVPSYLRLTQAEVQWLEKNPGKGIVDNGTYVEKI